MCKCTDNLKKPALTPEEFQYYAVKFQDGQAVAHHGFSIDHLGLLHQAVAVLVINSHAHVQRQVDVREGELREALIRNHFQAFYEIAERVNAGSTTSREAAKPILEPYIRRAVSLGRVG